MSHPIYQPNNLKRGEVITKVKNAISGEVYYTSNLYEKWIDGEKYAGVFTKTDDKHTRKVNWVKKDQLVKVK